MPDFNPNEMDALFREGAERHEFEYNSVAWALMEEKLDKKESKRRFLYYFLGFLIVGSIIGAIVYSSADRQSKEQDIAIASSIEENNETINNEENNRVDIVQTIESGSTVENDQSELSTFSTINQTETKNYIPTDSKESRSNIGAQNSFQSEDTGNLIGNEIVSMASHVQSAEPKQNINEVSKANNTNLGITNLNPTETPEVIRPLSIATLTQRNIDLFDVKERNFETRSIINSQAVNNPIVLANSNRFAVTVFANPEWSSVGLFQDSKAGWSVGTKFGYQFSNHFELSLGIALSKKIYKGAGAEYTMEGGWYDIEPVRMDAKCDVIEIPLGLSYYVNGFRNSGFFTDLGVSSYMLHSEWYGFDYDDALIRPSAYVDVNEKNENSHLVGVGRFAIGYQKVLSNNTALQVSPYIQFPLTGIGAGQVNLYSSGVQFAVKFNTQ